MTYACTQIFVEWLSQQNINFFILKKFFNGLGEKDLINGNLNVTHASYFKSASNPSIRL